MAFRHRRGTRFLQRGACMYMRGKCRKHQGSSADPSEPDTVLAIWRTFGLEFISLWSRALDIGLVVGPSIGVG
jgi:hypothetical protein